MNVLKPHLKTTVATLLANGASQREIERRTGVDRKTIRALLPELEGVSRVEANSPTTATGVAGLAGQIPPPWPPPEARWPGVKAGARQSMIGQLVDDAMAGIERDNPVLQGVLPEEHARPALGKTRLGQLIDLVSNISFTSGGPG